MELQDGSVNYVGYTSTDDFNLPAGKRIQLRDNGTGEVIDRFDEMVPAGKSWRVQINIEITETDA